MNGATSSGSRFSKWHIDPQRDEEQEAWLITYLDMLTLLLVMLVIMLSMAGKADGEGDSRAAIATPTAMATPEPLAIEAQPTSAPIPAIAPLPEPEPAIDAPVSDAQSGDTAEALALGEDIEVIVNDGSISFRISRYT